MYNEIMWSLERYAFPSFNIIEQITTIFIIRRKINSNKFVLYSEKTQLISVFVLQIVCKIIPLE